MILGLVVVEVIKPNPGPGSPELPVLRLLLGFPKFAVLVRLKNSVRNCRPPNSLIGNDRPTARSILRCVGPRRTPTPQLPNPVASGSPPTAGGAVKAA